jgi:ATP-dependent protease HslVU (ClpYQ) peptidase subunit
MTTIAYKNGTLAADSLLTQGTTRVGSFNKIEKLEDGSYIAMAGSVEVFEEVLLWLNDRTLPKPVLEEDDTFSALIVSPDKTVRELSNSLRFFKVVGNWAAGSGGLIALTAMHLGKTARQAIEVAIELDVGTGGKINSVKVF